MKTCKTNIFATVATLALVTGPALAQQDGMEMRDGERMTERVDPVSGATIRIITRQAAQDATRGTEAANPDVSGPEGSDMAETPTDDTSSRIGQTAESYGQSQRRDELAFGENERLDGTTTGEIRSADAPTTGVTDPMGDTEAASGDMDETGFDFESAGVDMNEFARELYERGYRQGYVSALTDLRVRAADQMRRDQSMRTRAERDRASRDVQRRDMQRGDAPGRVQIGQDANGDTLVILPPGMTPQMFLRQMSRMQGN